MGTPRSYMKTKYKTKKRKIYIFIFSIGMLRRCIDHKTVAITFLTVYIHST